MIIRIALVATLSLLSSCVIPRSTPEPYRDNVISSITPGETVRPTIEIKLGQPDVRLQNDSIWIYGEIWGLTNFEQYRSILLEFDGDTVRQVGLLKERKGCWNENFCLLTGWNNLVMGSHLVPERTAVCSRGEDDVQAKNFSPLANACRIYIYKEKKGFIGSEGGVPVSVGPVKDEPVHQEGYLVTSLSPGHHRLTVPGTTADFDCRAGDILFFAVELDVGWTHGEIRVNPVEEETGREAVLERHLLLPWN